MHVVIVLSNGGNRPVCDTRWRALMDARTAVLPCQRLSVGQMDPGAEGEALSGSPSGDRL